MEMTRMAADLRHAVSTTRRGHQGRPRPADLAGADDEAVAAAGEEIHGGNRGARFKLEPDAKRGLEELAVGLPVRADAGRGRSRSRFFDGRTPDVVIAHFG